MTYSPKAVFAPEPAATAPLWQVVVGLGATQVIGYGTLYYAFAILAPAIAAEFGVTLAAIFGVFSAGLLAGGLAAPRLGVLMDRWGAPRLMAAGSLAAALLVAGLVVAPTLPVFAVLIILLEIVSVMVLYDAAFASLVLLAGTKARGGITNLTLIAGFASTLFWPLTGWLMEAYGWRMTFACFAVLHLLVAMPIHVWLARQRPANTIVGPATPEPVPDRPALAGRQAKLAFMAVALSFALSGVLISALGVHLVPVLTALNLGGSAYIVAMLMGPAQVAVRLTNALFWRNMGPLTLAIISAAALPLAISMLLLPLPALLAGSLFAVMFGIGGGLSSIVRGTVPLALFGSAGYAARLGQLAAIRTVLSAGAPFLFAAGAAFATTQTILWVVALIGALATLPLIALSLKVRRVG